MEEASKLSLSLYEEVRADMKEAFPCIQEIASTLLEKETISECELNEIIKKYRLDDSAKKELCLKLGYDLDTEKMLSNGITALYSRPFDL